MVRQACLALRRARRSSRTAEHKFVWNEFGRPQVGPERSEV